jgi:hypothetical protein
MIFGIILSVICCFLILYALLRIIQEARGKNADWRDNVIYIIAPIGLAVSAFYYIFFLRQVDLANVFVGFGSLNIFLDIILNIILPAAVLSFLCISYRVIMKVGWHFFIITALGFILLSWLYIISLTARLSSGYAPSVRPEFPIVQWSCAVFIVALVVAVYERRREPLSVEKPAASE